MDAKLNDWVYFGVEGAVETFQWIYEKCPNSIFDAPLFRELKKWHEKYRLLVDVCVFERNGEFKLCDLQDVYWEEFRYNSDWMRLGWYQIENAEIKASVSEQIQSVERMYELVTTKCSVKGWSKVHGLYKCKGSAELISGLREKGVCNFLVSNGAGENAYDLTQEEYKKIQISASYDKNNYHYRMIDIQLEDFVEGKSVQEILELAQKRINIHPASKYMMICGGENVIIDKCDKIDQMLMGLSGIKKRLFMETSAAKNGNVYFTASYSIYLYCIRKDSKEIEAVTALPIESGERRFSSMCVYEEKLWMIPWKEKNFLVYDLKSNDIISIEFPYNSEEERRNNEYRKSVVCGKYLWLVPTNITAVIRVDMEEYSVCRYEGFPHGVSFTNNGPCMFWCVDICKNYLYLFSGKCSNNIRMNVINGEMEILNLPFNDRHGIMINENTVLLSPRSDKEGLCIVHLETGLVEEKELPEDVWKASAGVAFWYAYKIKEYVYVLPYEANAMLRYNCINDKVDVIKFPTHEYYSLRPNVLFVGYDVLQVGEEVWITSNMGNQILILDSKGDLKDIIDANVPIGFSKVPDRMKTEIYYERQISDVKKFLDNLSLGIFKKRKFAVEES